VNPEYFAIKYYRGIIHRADRPETGSDAGSLPEIPDLGSMSRSLRESGKMRAGHAGPCSVFCERGLAEISFTS
jgi:hypothetical protein